MVMQSQTQGTQGARIVGKGSATAEGPGPDVMAADTLDGNRVLSSDGEDIGKIKDIMLDVRSGRVAYAVLSSGSHSRVRFRRRARRSVALDRKSVV